MKLLIGKNNSLSDSNFFLRLVQLFVIIPAFNFVLIKLLQLTIVDTTSIAHTHTHTIINYNKVYYMEK